MVCWYNNRVVYNQRNLFDVAIKLEESILKNNNQINFTVTTGTWVLSTEWTRKWSNTDIVSGWCQMWSSTGLVSMIVVLVCLNGRYSSLECMVVVFVLHPSSFPYKGDRRRVLSFECKTDQAYLKDWMSSLPSNLTKEISPNVEVFSANT